MQGLFVIIINMDNLLTVIEAAEHIGVSPDTIRRWDKKGLIKAQRSDLNYRIFNIEEIKQLPYLSDITLLYLSYIGFNRNSHL